MGLDITIKIQSPTICPHCGEVVDWETIKEIDSNGRVWYDYLESVGYYVPYEKRMNGVKDKYGQDVVLTNEQAERLEEYVKTHDMYYKYTIWAAIKTAQAYDSRIVINANW